MTTRHVNPTWRLDALLCFVMLVCVLGVRVCLVCPRYGDMPPYGSGVQPQRVYAEGYAYLDADFPLLDRLKRCSIVEGEVHHTEEAAEDEGEEL